MKVKDSVLKGNDSRKNRKALYEYHVYIKPAIKHNFDGGPIKGMFIGVPKNLRSISKDISPSNDRIQAILLETGD